MGELHLEIYVERMRREYNVDCTTGKPRVAFRETITQRADFSYTHKKQTGGAGQFAKIMGYIEPMEPDPETGKDVAFESVVMGGSVPTNFIPAVEKVRLRGIIFRPSRSLPLVDSLGFLHSFREGITVRECYQRLSIGTAGRWFPRCGFL